jgi:hypothetical protein
MCPSKLIKKTAHYITSRNWYNSIFVSTSPIYKNLEAELETAKEDRKKSITEMLKIKLKTERELREWREAYRETFSNIMLSGINSLTPKQRAKFGVNVNSAIIGQNQVYKREYSALQEENQSIQSRLHSQAALAVSVMLNYAKTYPTDKSEKVFGVPVAIYAGNSVVHQSRKFKYFARRFKLEESDLTSLFRKNASEERSRLINKDRGYKMHFETVNFLDEPIVIATLHPRTRKYKKAHYVKDLTENIFNILREKLEIARQALYQPPNPTF